MEFDFYKTKMKTSTNVFKSKVFDEIEDALFVFTISANNDYDMPFINDSAYEMFEVVSDKMFTNTVLAVYNRIHDEDKELVKQSMFNAIIKRKKCNVVFRAHLPLNGLTWFRLSSKRFVNKDGSMELYGRVTDITESKEHELKLKIAEERFKFVLDTSASGVWDWNVKTNMVYHSPRSLKIVESEAISCFSSPESWNKRIHPDDLEKYNKVLQDHFANKTPFFECFYRVLTSANKYKWVLNKGKVIERDAKNKPLKVIGTHSDVSSHKEKELELMKQMEFSNEKNNRLLNFSHIISHNLNSHAGNFKLLLDMMDSEEHLGDKNDTMKYLRTVSDDLSRTIQDLSQIINIQNNADILVAPLNLNEYLSRVLNVVTTYNYRNNAVIINNVSPEAAVDFNPAYLESVLQNLCTNAIKYADPEKQLQIEFNFFVENGKKVLTIKDNGLGIDLEKYGNLLFGMYKTFHKHEEAHGMGLYITKNQIESMKGTIGVESQVGVGTTFKITFNG